MMLKLIDLLELSGITLGHYKLHCAVDNPSSGWRPLGQYHNDTFEWGQARQTRANFTCDHIVSMIQLERKDHWLFVGVYKVNNVKKVVADGWSFQYDLKRVNGFEEFEGRVVIEFKKKFKQSYLIGESYRDYLKIVAIREEPLSVAPFPGFNAIHLDYETLSTIVRNCYPSWKAGLASIAGIYLIMDRHDGRQYVGKASGKEGIWQRWSNYVVSGHGGNKEIRQVLDNFGYDHRYQLHFSLLEVIAKNSPDDFVYERESYWQQILMTRDFGLN